MGREPATGQGGPARLGGSCQCAWRWLSARAEQGCGQELIWQTLVEKVIILHTKLRLPTKFLTKKGNQAGFLKAGLEHL